MSFEITAGPTWCAIDKEGNLLSLSQHLTTLTNLGMAEEDAKALLLQSNQELIEQDFGCKEEQCGEALSFLLMIDLGRTFRYWENNDEGRAGISSKDLVVEASTPGAWLALRGLILKHKKARASGSLSVSYNFNLRASGAR